MWWRGTVGARAAREAMRGVVAGARAAEDARGASDGSPSRLVVAGKSVNSKDALEDKKDDNELWEAQAAFLGPNLWDKTLPYDPDLKVQEVSNRNFITYCVFCVRLSA